MRKVAAAVSALLILATVYVGMPFVYNSVDNVNKIRQYRDLQLQYAERLQGMDSELSSYRGRYRDVVLKTNVDLTKTVASMKGIRFVSATSMVELNGSLIKCAEVEKVGDVSFFSSQTKYIEYRLELVDLSDFIRSLGSSAIPVELLELDDGTVYLRVTAVFSDVPDRKGDIDE